jgi:hypothetical protein
MTAPRDTDVSHAPNRPRWDPSMTPVAPSRTALAYWSWFDLARHVLCGFLGGAGAAVLGLLLGPDLPALLAPGFHPLPQVLAILLWSLPLTAGLCLLDGHPWRARTAWLRALGRALLLAAAGSVVLGVALAATRRGGGYPYALWMGIGLLCGLAEYRAFPRARQPVQMVVAGVLGGVAAAVLAQVALPLTEALPGFIGPLARQAVLLPAAGMLLGFAYGFVREVAKVEWLLVVHGDQPGQLYPLYGTPFTIGTAPENRLVVGAAGGVRPCHANIRSDGGEAKIQGCDEGALVFLHNRRVRVSELYDGDEIQIGETVLRYYHIH